MSSRMRIILSVAVGLAVATGVAFFLLNRSNGQNSSEDKPQGSQGSYVALGDSVAAGIGLLNPSDSSACGRTNQAYPRQLADSQNFALSSLACSGATLSAGINGPQEVNKLAVKPQLDALYALAKPDVISLGIGANDANWTQFIGSCYTGNCNTPEQTAAVNKLLDTVKSGLKQTLDAISTRYTGQPPRLMLVGYYHVTPLLAADPTKCADLAGVDAGEQQWIRQQIGSLNDSLTQVSKVYDYVTFVPVDFNNHELCSSDPWMQGLNDKEPYHPTVDGQKTIAASIIKLLPSNTDADSKGDQ